MALCRGRLTDQQITGSPGNLSELAEFARHGSDEPRPELADGLRVVARELGVTPPWLGLDEVDGLDVAPAPA